MPIAMQIAGYRFCQVNGSILQPLAPLVKANPEATCAQHLLRALPAHSDRHDRIQIVKPEIPLAP